MEIHFLHSSYSYAVQGFKVSLEGTISKLQKHIDRKEGL